MTTFERILAFVQDIQRTEDRTPAASEVVKALGVSRDTVSYHGLRLFSEHGIRFTRVRRGPPLKYQLVVMADWCRHEEQRLGRKLLTSELSAQFPFDAGMLVRYRDRLYLDYNISLTDPAPPPAPAPKKEAPKTGRPPADKELKRRRPRRDKDCPFGIRLAVFGDSSVTVYYTDGRREVREMKHAQQHAGLWEHLGICVGNASGRGA